MDRCALFVDAAYLLTDGAMAVHGTGRRDAVSWDYPGLMRLLADLSRDRTGLPLLRCYWYDATVEGRRTAEHDTLADIPGLKLRLARIRPGRREGVDAQVHRDLMTLARNSAICDAVIVSGDEDLTQVVCDAQDLGMRVTVINVAPGAASDPAPRALRQECDDLIELDNGRLRPYVALSAGAEQPALGPGRSGGRRRGHALPSGRSAESQASAADPLSNGRLPDPLPQPEPLPVRRPEALPSAAPADHASRHAAAAADGPGDDPVRRTLEGLRDLSGDDSAGGQPPDTRSDTRSDAYEAMSLTGIDLPRITDLGPAQNGTPGRMTGQTGQIGQTGQTGGRSALGQNALGQNAPGQNAPGQSGPGQNGLGQGGLGQNGPVQNGLGQGALGQNGLGQGGPGQNGLGQGGLGQGGPGQNGLGQSGASPGSIASGSIAPGGVAPGGAAAGGVDHGGVAQGGSAQGGMAHGGTDRHATDRHATGAMSSATPAAMPSPPSSTGPAPASSPGYYSGSAASSNGSYQGRPPGASTGESTGAYPAPSGNPAPGPVNGSQPPGHGQPAPPAYTLEPRPEPSSPLAAPTGMQAYPGQHQQAPRPAPQQAQPPAQQQPPPLGPYTAPQPSAPVQQAGTTLTDAVKSAHKEGHDFGESVARDAPALWLEAVLARKPRMPSDLEARLLQGSSLPIDFLLHDEVRHALRRGFWDALENARH